MNKLEKITHVEVIPILRTGILSINNEINMTKYQSEFNVNTAYHTSILRSKRSWIGVIFFVGEWLTLGAILAPRKSTGKVHWGDPRK